MNNTNSNCFTLKATNPAFSQRQKDVFEKLNVLENKRKSTYTNSVEHWETNEQPEVRSNRSVTKHFRGKESIFKQPQDRAPKNFIRNIPDFKKNPHKWTKYTLSDVEEISETSNTNVALSFLNDLKKRKERESENEHDHFSKKILFNKPMKKETKAMVDEDQDSKPSFRSSRVVMPEYVVGQKIKKQKNVVKGNIIQEKKQEMKLDHLFENEDE